MCVCVICNRKITYEGKKEQNSEKPMVIIIHFKNKPKKYEFYKQINWIIMLQQKKEKKLSFISHSVIYFRFKSNFYNFNHPICLFCLFFFKLYKL